MPPTSAAMLTLLGGGEGALGSVPFTVVYTGSREDGDGIGGGVGDELPDEREELDELDDWPEGAKAVAEENGLRVELELLDDADDDLVPFLGNSEVLVRAVVDARQSHGPEVHGCTNPPPPSIFAPDAFITVIWR